MIGRTLLQPTGSEPALKNDRPVSSATSQPPVSGFSALSTSGEESSRPRECPEPQECPEPPECPPGDSEPAAGRSGLSRTMLNFWLDVAMGIVFAALCLTGVILRFVFPRDTAAVLWGMNAEQWGGLHFGILAVLAVGILVHVMLHWSWVCGVISRRILGRRTLPDDGIRTVYGVGLLIGILLTGAIIVGAAQWMIVLP